jgi:tryptophan synthase beta chain
MLEQEGRLPDMIIAAVGGGSNAIGLFHPFLDDKDVEIVGVEAGGHGLEFGERTRRLDDRRPPRRAARQPHLSAAGCRRPDPRRPFGLRRPRLSRRRPGAQLAARHRPRQYVPIVDQEALDAFQVCTRVEGIIPALESAHAIAQAIKIAPTMSKDKIIIVNLSGRGDKDVFTVGKMLGMDV